jgi:hypothetical protein
MGLDMYAFITNKAPVTPVDFPEPELMAQLHYWRKHPNLHGWMQGLYLRKGGRKLDFNCAPVVLDNADIDRLETDIGRGRLPVIAGPFFGCSDGDELEREDDLGFVKKARAVVRMGLTVIYSADW